MDFVTIVKLGRYFGLAAIALFVALKFLKIQLYRVTRNERIPFKLFSNFHQIEVYGTDSPTRRKFLLQCNRLNTYIWISIGFFMFAMALPILKNLMIK
jgi:hypothetical protein